MALTFDSMHWIYLIQIKSNPTLFATSAEYNKCRLYREMLTYKPLTNSAVQEEENIYQEG